MTVNQLGSQISSAELSEWYAYDQMNPLSIAERVELMLASQMALTANLNRRKGKKAYHAKDFLPRYGRESGHKQSPEEMKAILLAMAGK